MGDGRVDLAELSVTYSHQETILTDALGLNGGVKINPSGGPLDGEPDDGRRTRPDRRGGPRRSRKVTRQRAVAHATSGQPLQQNLVCVLEGDQ